MSRSKKKKVKSPQPWRTAERRRMTPYVADDKRGNMKFEPEQYEYGNGMMKRVSDSAKLEAKNANRSLKKGARQQAKKQLREELNRINN